MQLVKSENDVIVKHSSAGAKLVDLMSEYETMDPPKNDLFNHAPSAAKVRRNPISMRIVRGGLDHPFHYQLLRAFGINCIVDFFFAVNGKICNNSKPTIKLFTRSRWSTTNQN